jgi:hypothetical protein
MQRPPYTEAESASMLSGKTEKAHTVNILNVVMVMEKRVTGPMTIETSSLNTALPQLT